MRFLLWFSVLASLLGCERRVEVGANAPPAPGKRHVRIPDIKTDGFEITGSVIEAPEDWTDEQAINSVFISPRVAVREQMTVQDLIDELNKVEDKSAPAINVLLDMTYDPAALQIENEEKQ